MTMISLNGGGVASGNPDPYGPPLPGANDVRELERWCPNGVKRLLMGMERTARLDGVNRGIVQWMDERGLVRTVKQGPNAGHLALSQDGLRVWRTLNARMAGKS